MENDQKDAGRLAQGVTQAVMKHKRGAVLEQAKECAAYYQTNNPDIASRKKMYAGAVEDEDGGAIRAVAKENRFASNEKIASSFFRDITDSKVQYLAGEGADVNAVDDADADAVRAIMAGCERNLKRVGQECLTDALVYRAGYAYLQIIDNKPVLQAIPFCEVIPERDRYGKLCGVTRYYIQGGIEYAEKHTPESVYTFKRDKKDRNAGGWQFEGERPQITTAMRYPTGEEQATGGKGWAMLPWFELVHNNERTSSLTNAAKTMIRCYDLTISDFANNLADIQDVFINIKDSYGSGMEYGEIVDLVKSFKVGEGIDSVTTFDVPYLARQVLMDKLQAGIYAALRGVDVGRISGGNLTNTAIRALYSDIDLWADQAEWHMADWVMQILEALAWYAGVELPAVNVTFTRRAIFDEVEKMDAIARQKGIISDKTLYENHPLVTDAQAERERVDQQELDAAYGIEG